MGPEKLNLTLNFAEKILLKKGFKAKNEITHISQRDKAQTVRFASARIRLFCQQLPCQIHGYMQIYIYKKFFFHLIYAFLLLFAIRGYEDPTQWRYIYEWNKRIFKKETLNIKLLFLYTCAIFVCVCVCVCFWSWHKKRGVNTIWLIYYQSLRIQLVPFYVYIDSILYNMCIIEAIIGTTLSFCSDVYLSVCKDEWCKGVRGWLWKKTALARIECKKLGLQTYGNQFKCVAVYNKETNARKTKKKTPEK